MKKKTTKHCPNCDSQRIGPYMGFSMGTYNCAECNYIGSLILEKTKKNK